MRSARLSALLICSLTVFSSAICAQSDGRASYRLVQVQLRQSSGSFLGVRLRDIDADRAGALKLGEARGVEVDGVVEGTAAAEAGIKAGDVLLTYNGETILGGQQLGRLVNETPQGRRVKVDYWRAGKMHSTVVKTGAFPSPMSDQSPEPAAAGWSPMDIPFPMVVWKNMAMGFVYEPLDAQLATYFGTKYGVLIRSVDKDSPGEAAGLRPGDVITYLGTRSVSSPRDLVSFMRAEYQAGESVPVHLLRDHKDIRLQIAMPADRR